MSKRKNVTIWVEKYDFSTYPDEIDAKKSCESSRDGPNCQNPNFEAKTEPKISQFGAFYFVFRGGVRKQTRNSHLLKAAREIW